MKSFCASVILVVACVAYQAQGVAVQDENQVAKSHLGKRSVHELFQLVPWIKNRWLKPTESDALNDTLTTATPEVTNPVNAIGTDLARMLTLNRNKRSHPGHRFADETETFRTLHRNRRSHPGHSPSKRSIEHLKALEEALVESHDSLQKMFKTFPNLHSGHNVQGQQHAPLNLNNIIPGLLHHNTNNGGVVQTPLGLPLLTLHHQRPQVVQAVPIATSVIVATGPAVPVVPVGEPGPVLVGASVVNVTTEIPLNATTVVVVEPRQKPVNITTTPAPPPAPATEATEPAVGTTQSSISSVAPTDAPVTAAVLPAEGGAVQPTTATPAATSAPPAQSTEAPAPVTTVAAESARSDSQAGGILIA